MKISNKISISVFALALSFVLAGPITVLAAIDLGTAGTFSILSSTFTANGGITALTGDVGYTTLSGSGTITVAGGATSSPALAQTGLDQDTALGTLNALPCNFSFGVATDLSLLTQPLTPGVYCVTGAQSVGTAGITLSGNGTYVFRSTGALNTVDNSNVTLAGGASQCNVFWTPVATTLGANSTFAGTVIDTAAITVGSTVTWLGRALSYGKTITTDTDVITAPTGCGATPELPAVIIPEIISPVVAAAVSSGGGGTYYGCKDPKALNFELFAASNPALCLYPAVTVIAPVRTTTFVPRLPNTGFPPREKSDMWCLYY